MDTNAMGIVNYPVTNFKEIANTFQPTAHPPIATDSRSLRLFAKWMPHNISIGEISTNHTEILYLPISYFPYIS